MVDLPSDAIGIVEAEMPVLGSERLGIARARAWDQTGTAPRFVDPIA